MPENEEAVAAVYAKMVHKGFAGDVNRAVSGQTLISHRITVEAADTYILTRVHAEEGPKLCIKGNQAYINRCWCRAGPLHLLCFIAGLCTILCAAYRKNEGGAGGCKKAVEKCVSVCLSINTVCARHPSLIRDVGWITCAMTACAGLEEVVVLRPCSVAAVECQKLLQAIFRNGS